MTGVEAGTIRYEFPERREKHILSLLKNTAPQLEKQAELNSALMGWLEDCRRTCWVLVPSSRMIGLDSVAVPSAR